MALNKTLPLCFLVIFLLIKTGHAANPGTFFWKPILSVDLTAPATKPPPDFSEPTRENVKKGVVVMINGYEAGLTLLALMSGTSMSAVASTFNPFSAYFYTNAYRWALRHFSLLPQFVGGSKNLLETTFAWKRRFYYLDAFIPKFLRKALPYVKQEEWEKEEKEMVLFKKHAEGAFGKGYKYPNKIFNDFKSWETEESEERTEIPSITTEEIQG